MNSFFSTRAWQTFLPFFLSLTFFLPFAFAQTASSTLPQEVREKLAEGRLLLRRGEFQAAESRLREAQRAVPNDPTPLIALSELAQRQGQNQVALEYLRRARGLAPQESETALALGLLLGKLSLFDEALQALEQAHKLDPGSPEAAVALSLLLRDLNQREAAVDILEESLSFRPQELPLLQELSLLLLSLNDPEKASRIARRGWDLQPETFSLLLGLALAQVPEKRLEAVDFLQAALDYGGSHLEQAHVELGRLYLLEQRFTDSARHLRLAQESLPEDPQIAYLLATALRGAGEHELAEQELGHFQALQERQQRWERESLEWETNLNQAQELATKNRLGESLQLLGPLLEKRPSAHRAHALKAKVLLSMQQAALALEAIREAVRIQPGNPEYLYLLGLCQTQLEQYAAARVTLESLLRMAPHFSEPHVLLGRIAANRGEHAEAVEHFQQAVRLGSQDPALGLNLEASRQQLKPQGR